MDQRSLTTLTDSDEGRNRFCLYNLKLFYHNIIYKNNRGRRDLWKILEEGIDMNEKHTLVHPSRMLSGYCKQTKRADDETFKFHSASG